MTEEEFYAFAKQVEVDLISVNSDWAKYPFGTEAGLLEQYGQTFDDVGTIFYYAPAKTADDEDYRTTLLLDISRSESVPLGDGIDELPEVIPSEASTLVYYGNVPPQTPALSPIWFDTQTGDIRIYYSFNGDETWINTGVAGVGKIEFLNDLQDVDVLTTPPADTNHLEFDAGENKWLVVDLYAFIASNYATSGHTHSYSLEDIDDVSISNPKVGQSLKYNGTNWYNTKENVIYTISDKASNFSFNSAEGQNILYNVLGNYAVTIPTASSGNFDIGETVAILCNTSGVTFITTGMTIRIQASKQLSFLEADSIIYVTYIENDIIHISGSLADI